MDLILFASPLFKCFYISKIENFANSPLLCQWLFFWEIGRNLKRQNVFPCERIRSLVRVYPPKIASSSSPSVLVTHWCGMTSHSSASICCKSANMVVLFTLAQTLHPTCICQGCLQATPAPPLPGSGLFSLVDPADDQTVSTCG